MIYALANQKGGVGKSTSALNLAAAMVHLIPPGGRVLLVDLDPQCNVTFAAAGEQEFARNVYRLLLDRAPVEEYVVASRIYGVDLIPSHIDLAGAEVELASEIGAQTLLATKLARARLPHRHIILDCPPALGLIVVNALAAADRVLVPVAPGIFALRGLAKLTDTIDQVRERLSRPVQLGGIFLTMVDRTNVSRDTRALLESSFPGKVLETAIPRAVKVEEAHSRHESIATYAPDSPAAAAYLQLAKEVLRRG